MSSIKITLEDIQNYLGQQGKKQGDEMVFGCSICQLSGGDVHSDNLKWNTKKNVLYCFKDSDHSKIIMSEIMKKKHENKKIEIKQIPTYINNQEEYLYYQILCNKALLGTLDKDWIDEVNSKNMFEQNEYGLYLDLIKSDSAEKARAYLKSQRGINTSTIELTGLGFDFKDRKWVIPIFNMNCEIVGFRYRGADFKNKKVWTEKGTETTIVRFYGADKAKTLYIAEGEWDCIVLVQWLLENNQKDFTVVSSSNGAGSLFSVMNKIKLNNFEKIKLILDNDEAGNKTTNKIIEQYPFIIDSRDFLINNNIKDINDYYLKKVLQK